MDAAELGSEESLGGQPHLGLCPGLSKQAWPAHPWLWESLPPWPAWHSNPDKGGLSLSPLCSAAPEAALCAAKANSAVQLGSPLTLMACGARRVSSFLLALAPVSTTPYPWVCGFSSLRVHMVV